MSDTRTSRRLAAVARELGLTSSRLGLDGRPWKIAEMPFAGQGHRPAYRWAAVAADGTEDVGIILGATPELAEASLRELALQ